MYLSSVILFVIAHICLPVSGWKQWLWFWQICSLQWFPLPTSTKVALKSTWYQVLKFCSRKASKVKGAWGESSRYHAVGKGHNSNGELALYFRCNANELLLHYNKSINLTELLYITYLLWNVIYYCNSSTHQIPECLTGSVKLQGHPVTYIQQWHILTHCSLCPNLWPSYPFTNSHTKI